MISRRPNKRASTENAPGPTKTIAAAMVAARTAESFSSKRFGIGAARMENPIPITPSPTTTPATGVRMPINRAAPAASPTRPLSHIADEELALSR